MKAAKKRRARAPKLPKHVLTVEVRVRFPWWWEYKAEPAMKGVTYNASTAANTQALH